MQVSPNRHVLVRLRHELGGMTQKEFASLVGLSRPTIQSIELGRLRLSERVAHRISEETDIDVYWLLENQLDEPIRTRHGQPWNLECFHTARRGIWRGGYILQKRPVISLFKAYYELRAILAERDFFELVKDQFYLKLSNALFELWGTIPDREEQKTLYQEYRDETDHLDEEELLKNVISEARELLAGIRDLKKRTKKKTVKRAQPS